MAYDLEAMLVRVTGWNDDLNAGFATMREMKVMTGSDRRWLNCYNVKVLGLRYAHAAAAAV
jgi:hypothetical protein